MEKLTVNRTSFLLTMISSVLSLFQCDQIGQNFATSANFKAFVDLFEGLLRICQFFNLLFCYWTTFRCCKRTKFVTHILVIYSHRTIFLNKISSSSRVPWVKLAVSAIGPLHHAALEDDGLEHFAVFALSGWGWSLGSLIVMFAIFNSVFLPK